MIEDPREVSLLPRQTFICSPIELIKKGKLHDLIVELHRLREEQPL